jgi:hypothetical protein
VDIFDCLAVGEDVSTTSLKDARYWREFYRELSSFDQTLSRLRRRVAGCSGGRRDDAMKDALPALIADTETYERRFDFWQGRLAQLRHSSPPGFAPAR